ncbi:MAG: glycosyltransferase family protein [Nitrospinales bacterium]
MSDFEPVTAWAAKRKNRRVLGIGHQYAFNHDIPKAGADPIASLVMKLFAPADIEMGLHWHHFDQPVLPPIIEVKTPTERIQKNKIIVYLPFEEPSAILNLLSPFTDYEFHVYTAARIESKYPHILVKPLSRDGFQSDMHDGAGIISNAGFELASESLQLGKKILAKPLSSQMEQASNARAFHDLGYGNATDLLDTSDVEQWLGNNQAVRIAYPNVARILVQWIADGMQSVDQDWFREVWDSAEVEKIRL